MLLGWEFEIRVGWDANGLGSFDCWNRDKIIEKISQNMFSMGLRWVREEVGLEHNK